MSKGKVLVTGGTGFLGSHILKLLLEDDYSVVATVRDLKNVGKVNLLRNLVPEKEPELREATLEDSEEKWASVLEGCDYLVHVAALLQLTTLRDPQPIIRANVEGVEHVLGGAAKAGIKRVVYTSSIAAVSDGHMSTTESRITEEHWSDQDQMNQRLARGMTPYHMSKTLAEKKAWEISEKGGFELAVICPGLVLGPVLHNFQSGSVELIQALVDRRTPVIPDLHFALVDVRDCARAHVTALTHEKAAGQRFLSLQDRTSNHHTFLDLAKILDAELKPLGYSIPQTRAPKWVLRVVSLFDSGVAMFVDQIGERKYFQSSKLKDTLGLEDERTMEQSVLDTAHSLISRGVCHRTKQYLAAHPSQ